MLENDAAPGRRPSRQGRGDPPAHRSAVGNRRALRGHRGGCAHPARPPLPGSGDDEFMWNYAGGWQELFPSVNEACVYRGNPIPFHGEVASLPWEYEILDERQERGMCAVLDAVPADPVPGRARPPTARRRTGARGRGVGEERVDAERALRLGSSLCRRAAVSRAGLPARDPRSDDRHVTRALGAGDGTARAGSSGAVAVGDRCGPEGRSTFATSPARRRGATTISTSPISTRGGSRCRTRGSS